MTKLAFVMEDTGDVAGTPIRTGIIVDVKDYDFTIKDLFEKIKSTIELDPFLDRFHLPMRNLFLYPQLESIDGVLVGVVKIDGFELNNFHELPSSLLENNSRWTGAVCSPEAVALFIKNEGYNVDPTDRWKGFYNTNS
jgi:hypothetical protein